MTFHLKSDAKAWKKSPNFGSVKGDKTTTQTKEALLWQVYKSAA